MNNEEKIKFITDSVMELFGKNIGAVSNDTRLSDLGLDSLDVVELEMYYEEKTGNIIDEDKALILFSDLLRAMK